MPTKYVSEPPPSTRGKYERGPHPSHVKIVKALQKRPGRWMKVREFESLQGASRFAKHIREGKFIAFRDGEYDAVSRHKVVHAVFHG